MSVLIKSIFFNGFRARKLESDHFQSNYLAHLRFTIRYVTNIYCFSRSINHLAPTFKNESTLKHKDAFTNRMAQACQDTEDTLLLLEKESKDTLENCNIFGNIAHTNSRSFTCSKERVNLAGEQ